MFGFLATLAGVAGVSMARENQKLNAEANARRADYWIYRLNIWGDKVRNIDLEDELIDFIIDYENYDEVWAELSKAYEQMGIKREFLCFNERQVIERYGTRAFTRKEREKLNKSHRTEAVLILLANRGYLPRDLCTVCYGYHCELVYPLTNEWYDEAPKLMLWVNEQLKKHGIDEEIYGLSWDKKSAYVVGSEAFKRSKIQFFKYAWKPQLYEWAKIYK